MSHVETEYIWSWKLYSLVLPEVLYGCILFKKSPPFITSNPNLPGRMKFWAEQKKKKNTWNSCLHIFTVLNPGCMTAAISPITELSIKLRFNDRFGCPHNAMCVCVMVWGFISELNKRHLLERRMSPLWLSIQMHGLINLTLQMTCNSAPIHCSHCVI